MRLFLAILVCASCYSATWYVRPPVHTGIDGSGKPRAVEGVYGSQDGTSYDDAWNGLREVVWGAGGVDTGDTLYVCGTHIHRCTNNSYLYYNGLIPIGTNGVPYNITIRGDYAADSGVIWGALQGEWGEGSGSVVWNGPDENGVSWTTNYKYEIRFQDVGGSPQLLSRKTSRTFTTAGSSFWEGTAWNWGTNWVKPVDGYGLTNFLMTSPGYRFYFPSNSSQITFHKLSLNWSIFECKYWGTGEEDHWTNANNITFNQCKFDNNSYCKLHPGFDDWSFLNCEFTNCQYGVYQFLDSKTKGANRLTVSRCTFSNIGTDEFPDNDEHAIGIQGGSGHLIEYNYCTNTGTAIEFWTHSQSMSNGIVMGNTIVRPHVSTVTGGSGILVSGDSSSVVGLRTGFKIYGNVIVDPGINSTESWHGTGIGSNNKDSMLICNNVIIGGRTAISLGVVGDPVHGEVYNNIIISPSYRYFYASGSSRGILNIGTNMFYPASDYSSGFYVISGGYGDNYFDDPEFFSTNVTDSSRFYPSPGSPVYNAGYSALETYTDLVGKGPFEQVDIGAREWWPVSPNVGTLTIGTVQ